MQGLPATNPFERQTRVNGVARLAQTLLGMAAVFALVFVPGLAAVLFMFGAVGGSLSVSTAFAATVFVALAAGLLTGLFRLAHKWEDERQSGA